MTVRAAERGDVAAIARLETECLGVDAWPEGMVGAGVSGGLPTIRYFVAVEEGDVVGHAVVSCVAEIAELQRIAVVAPYRRTGLASALLVAVVEAARDDGADRLLLEVRVHNTDALAFYAHHGFVEIDRRRGYYRDGADAVVMRLPLLSGCG